LESLERFLDEVLAHLGNRTTAQERVSYHTSEAYTLKEDPVPYGTLRLQETDIYARIFRALPPAEHMVLLSWFRNDAQLALARAQKGFVYVRLGRRSGLYMCIQIWHAFATLRSRRQVARWRKDCVC